MIYQIGFGSGSLFTIIPFIVITGFILAFLYLLYQLIKGIAIWHSNNNAEVITINAKVIDKRNDVRVSGGGGNNHHVSTHNTYYVTFELENSERLVFKVKPNDYSLLLVGDEGELNYQGTRFNKFLRIPNHV